MKTDEIFIQIKFLLSLSHCIYMNYNISKTNIRTFESDNKEVIDIVARIS
jgi:hypothetical protein